MNEKRWISVPGWRKFQHYDPEKRQPRWIKVYTELMSDDAYRALTGHQRAVLHGIWLEYASSRCQLALSSSSLSSRLGLRVASGQLKALRKAGFIDFVASKTLAEGYQPASPEVEVKEKRERPVSLGETRAVNSTASTTEFEIPDNLAKLLKTMPK